MLLQPPSDQGDVDALSSQTPVDALRCITKLQQCQLLLQPLSDPEDIDPCSTQTPVDACAISSKAVDCLRVNLSSCMSISQVKDLVNTLTATRDQSCSPGNVCQQKLSLCACDLKKVQPDGGEVNSESVALVWRGTTSRSILHVDDADGDGCAAVVEGGQMLSKLSCGVGIRKLQISDVHRMEPRFGNDGPIKVHVSHVTPRDQDRGAKVNRRLADSTPTHSLVTAFNGLQFT
ncbi:hypothetical protein C0Q70_04781 [Pomacea canaliculata]|uniref:Uncharacterized protein n=1 Tax=Pomacea canaliculata TaxID=400727 RepID=A0A2T7PJC1_POMCA|nr:hypothetical protein C0Q70_04781 [Pomacea canaliculata]